MKSREILLLTLVCIGILQGSVQPIFVKAQGSQEPIHVSNYLIDNIYWSESGDILFFDDGLAWIQYDTRTHQLTYDYKVEASEIPPYG